MGSALPIDLLVSVTSTGIKDTFTIGKLPTLLITKYNDKIPLARITQYTNLSAVKSAFKSGSVVDFANEYFGFSSKNGTKADLLSVFVLNSEDLSATLKGAKISSLGNIKTLQGEAVFTIDNQSFNVSLDFTNAESLSDCANVIQVALQGITKAPAGFKTALVEFNTYTQGFVIKSGTKGETAKIDFVKDSTNSNIGNKLGLSQNEGAELIQGMGACDLSSALDIIESNNGNYYVITFDYTFENLQDDLAVFGKWLKASNGRFLGIYSDSTLLNVDLSDREGDDGLLLDYKVVDSQNGFVSALISSLDLSKSASNVNIAFNDATSYQSNAITERSVYEKLQSKKLNSICKFGILGQDDSIYMQGDIMGTLTNSANVYLGNSFIKFNEQIALYNMLKSQKLIGLRDLQSRNTIQGYITEVFENAVSANIIAKGAELTTTEQSTLISTFGTLVDSIDDVLNQIEKFGYYFVVSDVNVVTKEMTITQAYMANQPLRKIVISNYVLGA